MLRLSTRGRYGVRAMYEIAKSYPNPVSIKYISEKQALSVPYLEQILNRLKNAGLLTSIRGPGGGYVLKRRPEEISIIEILKELDGPPAIASCLDPKKGCFRIDVCVTHIVWKMLSEQIEGFLRKITLADLLKLGEKIEEV
ncbi:MAG: Rrf2 family transcriptional regulator [Archaeoglobaceae archaeon]